jgi:hypothetical protein
MTLTITVSPKTKSRRVVVEFDADRFERLAAGLGLFSPEFLESLKRAEQELDAGKAKKLKNLRALRRP